jgi:hypothetical protein
MNALLWTLQVLLALHTLMGAVWKLTNPVQAVPSLKAITSGGWKLLSAIEVLCAVGLVLPALHGPLAILAPIAAAVIAAEMLLFCALHVRAGDPNRGPMVYWLVAAAVCAFVAYGRFVLHPL